MTPTSFRVTGLPVAPFQPLFAMTDEELHAHHAKRYVVDAMPGFPDRIELRDADVGERVILVNHEHLPDAGPFRSRHAVYVIEGATRSYDAIDRIPDVLRRRMLSLRAFDAGGMMVDATLVAGVDLEPAIGRFLADPAVAFLHCHYATRGCYACRIDRVDGVPPTS